MLKLMAAMGITLGTIYYFIWDATAKLATSEVARIDMMFKAAGLE